MKNTFGISVYSKVVPNTAHIAMSMPLVMFHGAAVDGRWEFPQSHQELL
jgi:hypothetical protein